MTQIYPPLLQLIRSNTVAVPQYKQATASSAEVISGTVSNVRTTSAKSKRVTVGTGNDARTVWLHSDMPQSRSCWNVNPGTNIVWSLVNSQCLRRKGQQLWGYYRFSASARPQIQQTVKSINHSNSILSDIEYFLDQLCESQEEYDLLTSYQQIAEARRIFARALTTPLTYSASALQSFFLGGDGLIVTPLDERTYDCAPEGPTFYHKQNIRVLLSRMEGLELQGNIEVSNIRIRTRQLQQLLQSAKAFAYRDLTDSVEIVSRLLLPDQRMIFTALSGVQILDTSS